jgi:hypothetical protein
MFDFKREYLMPYQLSRQGPKMAKADVNSDGLEDVYIGGAAGQSGILYLQVPNNKFKKSRFSTMAQRFIIRRCWLSCFLMLTMMETWIYM